MVYYNTCRAANISPKILNLYPLPDTCRCEYHRQVGQTKLKYQAITSPCRLNISCYVDKFISA